MMPSKCTRCGQEHSRAGEYCEPCRARTSEQRKASRRAAGIAASKNAWTPAEDKIVRDGRAVGMTCRQLAAKLGRTMGAVQQRTFRLDHGDFLEDDERDVGDASTEAQRLKNWPPLRIEDFMRSGRSATGL